MFSGSILCILVSAIEARFGNISATGDKPGCVWIVGRHRVKRRGQNRERPTAARSYCGKISGHQINAPPLGEEAYLML